MFRCDMRQNGKQCVLRPEHVGKVPCRFTTIEYTVSNGGKPVNRNTAVALGEVARMAMSTKQVIRMRAKELRQPEMDEWHCSIPIVPPSVNHYKLPRKGGKGYYLSKEAKAFQAAVCSLTKGSIRKSKYYITVTIFLGYNQRGDADNFGKVPLDALVKARVITTDARVKAFNVFVERDAANPTTEITIVGI